MNDILNKDIFTGALFSRCQLFHEERVLAKGGILEGLQIFTRPETAGLKPQVQFHQLQEMYSINNWRKLAR